MPTWSAEVEVDEPLVRRLLAQFPDLAGATVEPLDEGWDRSVWLVGGAWVFGFPRRAVVVPGLQLELDVLPRLAPLLPLPIPEPAFVGRPGERYPWPFFGSRLLPGRELGEARLDAELRTATARELAAFLRRLHSPEVAETVGLERLPRDANRRADMDVRVPRTREQLADVAAQALWRAPPSVARLLDEAERLGPSLRAGAVLHGDLHFRHLLVDGGRASGVIDWIDVCRGDPAVDLSLLWSYFGGDARAAFLVEYGEVAEDQLVRARVVALSLSASLALYGRDRGLPAIERAAVAGLGRASGRGD